MSVFLLILVFLAVAVTQMLAGGRQVFLCLPGYGLLAMAAFLSWWPRRRTPIPKGALECLGAAVLFCTYVSIRALFSPEAFLARNDLFAALAAMALYLLIALNVTASRLRLLLVGGILALALANCAIGAVQFFKGQNFMPFPFLPRSNYGWRASGFYGYPNLLAGFLEMALMLGLSMTFWSRWPSWAKMLTAYICGMCLLTIVVTGSRGGYISTTIGLTVFAALSLALVGKLAPGRVIGLILAGMLLIGGGAWGLKQVVSKSFFLQSRAEETLTVDASRMRLWQAAWKQFRLQPVVGTGSGTYLYYGRQFRSPGLQTDPVHAHNDYFEVLAEYGILGIIAAVIFLETHLRCGWNSFTRRISQGTGMASNSLALTVGGLSAAAACLVHCLLDYNLHMPANLLTAAVIFGLLATPGEGPDAAADSERDGGYPPFLRLALPALGLLIFGLILPKAPAEYYAQRTRLILSDPHRSVSPEPDEEMIALARRGLTADPHNPDLHFAIGEAKSAMGELATDPQTKEKLFTEAAESYMAALAYAPGDVRTVLTVALALDELGRFSESEPLCARALELDPRGGATHISVGFHFVMEGKFAEAEAQFRLGKQYGAALGAQAGMNYIEEEKKAKGGGTPTPSTTPKPN
ncbi:MAG: O-antigen ligase family protein [Chthoniobacter sp.]|uniref:O-antigen ligase family protein n=1 Tax=Chthoniobacter sp. TaxID=2510640 RepID=UPI0032A6EDE1